MDVQLSEFCSLPCKVLMDKNPLVAEADENSVEVASRMLGVDYKTVIVYEDGDPIGLITLKDIMKWLLAVKDKSRLLLGDLVSVPLITVEANTTIEDATNTMNKYRINYLGVCENRAVRGLVTKQGIKEFCELYPHYLRRYVL